MSDYLMREMTLDLLSSIDFDKEAFLNRIYESSGVPLEVFLRYIVLEEYPITITQIDDIPGKETRFRISQEFRVRMKTFDELNDTLPALTAVLDNHFKENTDDSRHR